MEPFLAASTIRSDHPDKWIATASALFWVAFLVQYFQASIDAMAHRCEAVSLQDTQNGALPHAHFNALSESIEK